MNSSIRFLNTISLDDTPLCGGKGSSLGELTRMGVAVPKGFVITTEISPANLRAHEKGICVAFDALKATHVAVRSSATKEDSHDSSFAGQFDTFLNVDRRHLIAKIKACYASLHSDRITSYCKSQKIPLDSIKVAIVVQKMVQSEVAGVGFSANPVNDRRDEIMVEAGFGLGEYVVSGIITPDKLIFDEKSSKLKEIKINYQEHALVLTGGANVKTQVPLVKRNAQKLPLVQATSLVATLKNIEKHYKKPVDIEWAIENGKVYIMQARPITTLK